MARPTVSRGTYYLIFAALLGLTGATVWASYLPLGGLHLPAALLIATAKALLVLLFFMHLWYSTRLTWVVALSGLLWVAILIVLTMADYVTRENLGIPGR
jgi:cytochrome c oxidase subunit 4